MKKDSLKKLIAGIEIILEVLKEEVGQVPDATCSGNEPVKAQKGKAVSKTVKAPVEEKEEDVEEENGSNREEELNAMSFNDVKKLAKEMGIKAIGNKATIIEKILEEEGVENEDEESEIISESHENEEDGESEETETLYDLVVKELEGYTDEELAEILSDIGVSPKGKRQALLTKIVQAVEEGKLDFSDDAEEEEEEEEEADSKEENEEVSPERAQAMEELEDTLRKAYKDKEISDKEIANLLKEYHNGEHKGNKKENLEEYIRIMVSLIDEDGEEHEFSDAYYVNEEVYCCGKPLQDIDGKLYCEICGEEYEA